MKRSILILALVPNMLVAQGTVTGVENYAADDCGSGQYQFHCPDYFFGNKGSPKIHHRRIRNILSVERVDRSFSNLFGGVRNLSGIQAELIGFFGRIAYARVLTTNS